MRILYNIRNNEIKDKLLDFCKKYNYDIIKTENFADVFLFHDITPDIFICEVDSKCYIDFYKKMKCENVFHIPRVFFIYANADELCLPNCFSQEKILSSDFNISYLLSFNSMFELSNSEQDLIEQCFKNFGLTYLCQGTKYLEMVIKLLYLYPQKYLKNLDACYEFVSMLFCKTKNAIKKSINRAIDYAYLKQCKGIIELENYYGQNITAKLIVTYILSNFLYVSVG